MLNDEFYKFEKSAKKLSFLPNLAVIVSPDIGPT